MTELPPAPAPTRPSPKTDIPRDIKLSTPTSPPAPAPSGPPATRMLAALSDRAAKIGAMENYTYRAQWSFEYGENVGTCIEFPLETARAPTAHEAIASIERAVGDIVKEYLECGTDPPPSLSDGRYSGNFMVRTSPALHARLMIEAAEQGGSLNQWAVQRLADRPASLSIDDLF